jgi:hypothetical protein
LDDAQRAAHDNEAIRRLQERLLTDRFSSEEIDSELGLVLGDIRNSLEGLRKHDIKSLNDFLSAPLDRRYLPSGYAVRQNLYIVGSGYNRTTYANKQRAALITKVKDVQKRGDAAGWAALKAAKQIDSTAAMAAFDPNLIDRSGERIYKYNVDHTKSLAEHWKGPGHNCVDKDRFAMSAEPNLQFITEEENLKKGSKGDDDEKHFFVENDFVGPAFRSGRAENGRENAHTIDGRPLFKDPQRRTPL